MPLCKQHQQPIRQIEFSQSNKQNRNKRLFCDQCNLNGYSNLINIGNALEFLSHTQIKYNMLNQIMEKMDQDISIANSRYEKKSKIIKEQILTLKSNIEKKKLITKEDLQKYLNNPYSVVNLIELANFLSGVAQFREGNIELNHDFIEQQELELTKKISKDISSLSTILNPLLKDERMTQLEPQNIFPDASVPYEFICIKHNQPIYCLDFTENLNQDERLICLKCLFQKDQFQNIALEKIFQFLQSTQVEYTFINQQVKSLFDEFKIQKQRIFNFINDLEQQLQQLTENIKQSKFIKEVDLMKYLSKEIQYGNEYLSQLVDELQGFVQKNNGNIKMSNNIFNEHRKFEIEYIHNNLSLMKQSLDLIEQPFQINYPLNKFQKISEIDMNFNYKILKKLELNATGEYLVILTSKQIYHDQQPSNIQIWIRQQDNKLEFHQHLVGHNKEVESVCFNPIDNSLVTGSVNGVMIYWIQDINTLIWTQHNKEQFDGKINCIKIEDESNWMASSCLEDIFIWKYVNNQWEINFQYQGHRALSLNFSEDSKLLISGGLYQEIIIFELQNDNWSPKLSFDPGSSIRLVAFIDYNSFFSIDDNKVISFWISDKSKKWYNTFFKKHIDINTNSISYCPKKGYIVGSNIILQLAKKSLEIGCIYEFPDDTLCCSISNDGRWVSTINQTKLI